MYIKNKVFEVIVGTNEEFILGYYISPNADGTLEVQPSFSNHSHTGRVKQVAISDQFLISGSTDEHLRIFNLYSRKELGYLLPHEGTITCLEYHKSGFFFSAAEDGKIVIFKKGKWEIEKELVGHNSPVNSIAIHPSGKLGLSVSRNKRMITWDLVKGKRAYLSGLQKVGEIVMWSPSGQHYIISSGTDLDIYEVETGNICQTFNFKERINCLLFLSDELLAVGVEGGYIYLYNLITNNEILSWGAHNNRIKSLVSLDYSEEEILIASASSDGYVKFWSIKISSVPTKKLETMVDTKSRIICMSARISHTNVFDNSDDVEKFEEEFQQKQDDYHSLQTRRKLENRKKIKYSGTVKKARVVVVNEGKSMTKKKLKGQNDKQKLVRKKKTNKANRNSTDSVKLTKKLSSVKERLTFTNKGKTSSKIIKNKKDSISKAIGKNNKLIVDKLNRPINKKSKLEKIGKPSALKLKKVPLKNKSNHLLKTENKKLKLKKKITLLNKD